MATNDNDRKYTAADFERYHNGTMPEAEMYALEKAALEDPFLSDALDGYVFTETAQKDILKLKEKIPPQKENKKSAPIVSFSSMWLRIAAIFILVSGIGYISYVSLSKRPENTFAKLDEAPKAETVIQPVITDADKIATPQTQTSVETNIAPKKENGLFDQKDNKTIIADNVTEDALIQRSEKEVIAEAPAPVALYQKSTTDNKNKYLLKGQVVNEKGEPVSFANVQTADKKNNVSADADGRFSMTVSDTLTNTDIAALGYATAKKTLKANEDQKIILEENNQTLDEVVVTGNGQTRRKTSASVSKIQSKDSNNTLTGKVEGVNIARNGQPVNGASQFDQYITENLKVPVKADHQPYKGSVTLSFSLNENGEPEKIKVEKGLCKECDAEAIRLLKAGPKWTTTSGNRITTTIEF